ncbi:MAG: signal peptidase II [Deltaproteobacteria bacterium]|nr:MAG: signal peptidase II [Deltaproteobacteria bacterium]
MRLRTDLRNHLGGILSSPRFKLFLGTTAGVLFLDQASKAVVSSTLKMHEIKPLVKGLINLTRLHNTGVAFGLLSGEVSTLRTLLFLSASLLAMGIVIWMLLRLPPDRKVEQLALSLIFGGALGNLLDRVRLGEVVDFIDIYYRNYHWPAFNVADSAISVGVTLLIWRLAFTEQ